MLKKKIFGIAAAGILAASTLAACGSSSSSETTAATEATETTTAATSTFDISNVTASDLVENGTVAGVSSVDGSRFVCSRVTQDGSVYDIYIGEDSEGNVNQLVVLANPTTESSTNSNGVPVSEIKGTDVYTGQEFTFGIANQDGTITIVTPASENNTYVGAAVSSTDDILAEITKAANFKNGTTTETTTDETTEASSDESEDTTDSEESAE